MWAMDVEGLAGVIGVRDTPGDHAGPEHRGRLPGGAVGARAGSPPPPWVAVRDELARVGYQRIDWEALAGNEASVRPALERGLHDRRAPPARDVAARAPSSMPSSAGGPSICRFRNWSPEHGRSSPVPIDVPAALRPAASNALGGGSPGTAVGGRTPGLIMAT